MEPSVHAAETNSCHQSAKRDKGASEGSWPVHSSRWMKPVSPAVSLRLIPIRSDACLDRSCLQQHCADFDHQRTDASRLPPTPDHSSDGQDEAHSAEDRDAGRMPDLIFCGRSDQRRLPPDSCRIDDDRLGYGLSDLPLRCRGQSSANPGKQIPHR